jgi:biopolymer transport protein ExbB/TolQ
MTVYIMKFYTMTVYIMRVYTIAVYIMKVYTMNTQNKLASLWRNRVEKLAKISLLRYSTSQSGGSTAVESNSAKGTG